MDRRSKLDTKDGFEMSSRGFLWVDTSDIGSGLLKKFVLDGVE